MSENDFIKIVNQTKKLSAVKERITRKLYSTMGCFVSRKEIEVVAKQGEFTRRIRELIQENGLDITSDIKNGYRLNSLSLNHSKIRKPFTDKQRMQLFERSNYCCDVCGKFIDKDVDGLKGLQADHKIPVDRNGTNDINNGQTLCQHCNVSKKRTCEGCVLNCSECVWAFPEAVGMRSILNIPSPLMLKIEDYANNKKSNINDVIIDILEHKFESTINE